MTRTGRYQRCGSALHWLKAIGALALSAMFGAAVIGTPAAQAQTYSVVHRFKGSPTDGANPGGGHLIGDSAGNLYGTTVGGGASGAGVVFKLDKTGKTVLYNFTGGADGSNPYAGLIRDSAGNLYGTTDTGGASGHGVVFKLDTTGTETVLYNFTGGVDGSNPYAGLVRDPAGNFYGTTLFGGTSGQGVVFKLDTTRTETVLHSFTGGADGSNPFAGVVRDSVGNLYGTTQFGGLVECHDPEGPPMGCGVVFKLDTTGKLTVLYSFTGGADGWDPYGGLTRDSAGNLYGTTSAFCCGGVFKLDTTGKLTVLYSFTGGDDGGFPAGRLIRDPAGNLYGTTAYGGPYLTQCGLPFQAGCGVVFKLDTTGKETVLYSFTGGTDGANPEAGLIQDSAGDLYGTTQQGGRSNNGVVFLIQP